MAKTDLTAQRLRELLHYDPETGVFTWRDRAQEAFKDFRSYRAWESRFCGKKAGCIASDGHIVIRVEGRLYFAHRLAWLHMYGAWPLDVIDHKNGVRHENMALNIRDASAKINGQNLRTQRKGKHLPLGVSLFKKTGRFSASIRVDGKSKHLGYFVSATEAQIVYVMAKRLHHEGCTI